MVLKETDLFILVKLFSGIAVSTVHFGPTSGGRPQESNEVVLRGGTSELAVK